MSFSSQFPKYRLSDLSLKCQPKAEGGRRMTFRDTLKRTLQELKNHKKGFKKTV